MCIYVYVYINICIYLKFLDIKIFISLLTFEMFYQRWVRSQNRQRFSQQEQRHVWQVPRCSIYIVRYLCQICGLPGGGHLYCQIWTPYLYWPFILSQTDSIFRHRQIYILSSMWPSWRRPAIPYAKNQIGTGHFCCNSSSRSCFMYGRYLAAHSHTTYLIQGGEDP